MRASAAKTRSNERRRRRLVEPRIQRSASRACSRFSGASSPTGSGCSPSGAKQGLLKKALEAARRRRAMRLEALEPRVLLSADIAYSSGLLDPALDLTLKFAENAGTDVIQLINNDDDSVISEQVMPRRPRHQRQHPRRPAPGQAAHRFRLHRHAGRRDQAHAERHL